MRLSFSEIVEATKCEVIKGKENGLGFEFSTDSRTIKDGDIYIALSGEKFDGHDFLENIKEQGAKGCIISDKSKLAEDFDYIFLVQDTKIAYLELSSFYKQKTGVKTVAITGSNGKTTTKEMMYSVCAQKFRTVKTKLNHNNEIGLCQTMSELTKDDEVLIVEMGMRGLGEIELLSRYAKPDLAIIVNVTETHIGRLGSIENIAKAKCEITSHLNPDGTLIALDSDLIRNANTYKGETIYFSLSSPELKILETTINSSKFEYKGQVYELNIAGEYNVQNALGVIETALKLGIEPELIAKGLKEFKQIEKRWEEIKLKGFNIINDSYNASPASVRASVKTFLTYTPSPKVIVFGNMGELGDNEIRYHREIGEYIDNFECDNLLTLGDLAKNAEPKKIDTHHFETKEDLVNYMLQNLKQGSNVLLKASRSMKFEEIIKELEQR
ncbi:UDP-N-acetylmuramoyl-tripeptide--D-alanyl-D-alanine ligase [bacterium]|nr:UDP-N-acetylmuramoyl-tripeptide--D-alanyl-D-alanine ligase [bacterium]